METEKKLENWHITEMSVNWKIRRENYQPRETFNHEAFE